MECMCLCLLFIVFVDCWAEMGRWSAQSLLGSGVDSIESLIKI